MNKIIKTFVVILVALFIAVIGSSMILPYFDNYSQENLDPDENIDDPNFFRLVFSQEEFTILQLTDFHEWAGIEEPKKVVPKNSLKPHLVSFINDILDDVEPDFVVVTGDNIFPLSYSAEGKYNVSLNTIRYIADIFEQREQYWTLTFGNHDTESRVSKEKFLEQISEDTYFIGENTSESLHRAFRQDPLTLTQASRMGNYSIPIYRNDNLFFNLYVLDSGSYYSPGIPGRNYLAISQEQTNWYEKESNRLKARYGSPTPSIMFTHIPIIEMRELYDNYTGEIYGVYGGISNSTKRSPIYEKCLELKDVRAIFFGHNHNSSLTLFDERYPHKIMLGITPQCAATSYQDSTSTMYGRVIKIDQNANFYTYIYSSNQENDHIFLNQIIYYTAISQ